MDAHGNELQTGTDCLGAFLLYRLLQPILAKTAASSPEGSVRVTGAGSSALELISPKPHGMKLEDDGRPKDKGVQLISPDLTLERSSAYVLLSSRVENSEQASRLL